MPEEVLNLSDLQPRDFSPYFLSENPFPPIAVAEENPRIFVDREAIMNQIHDIIRSSVLTGKSQTMVIQGTYGSGKSHILKYTKSRINSQLSARPEQRALAVYVENPRISFAELYSGVVSGLGLLVMKELGGKLISDYILSHQSELDSLLKADANKPKKEELIKKCSEPRRVPEVLQYFKYGDLFHRVVKSKENFFKIPEYIKVITQLLLPVSESSSWRWLRAETVLRGEKEGLQVTSIIDEQNALDAMSDFLQLYRSTGYSVLFILLDELERIVELRAPERSRYFDDLRHLIDRNPEGMGLIACVTPTGFDEIRASGHPLERRLFLLTERLETFDAKKTNELIKAYIAVARNKYLEAKGLASAAIDEKIKKLGQSDSELFPFTKNAISGIQKHSLGNVGFILSDCHRLLNAACDKKIDAISDESFVTSVLGSP